MQPECHIPTLPMCVHCVHGVLSRYLHVKVGCFIGESVNAGLDYWNGLLDWTDFKRFFSDKRNVNSKVARLFPQHGVHQQQWVGSLPQSILAAAAALLQSSLDCRTFHLSLSASTSPWENAGSTTDHPLHLTGVYCFVWSLHGTTSTL